MRAPERRDYDLPDGSLSAVHYGDTSQPLRVVFLHANGFNGLAYKSVFERLGVHSAAFDSRGHGRSRLPIDIDGLSDYNIFRDDILHILNDYIDGRVVVAGHSFGAVTATLLAPYLKERMAGYVGFDPVTAPGFMRVLTRRRWGRGLVGKRFVAARKAGRRKSHFESVEAAFARYQGRGAFRGFSDAALRDYLAGGFLPDDGGVKLACDPLWEKAIYTAHGHNIFKASKYLPKGNSYMCFAQKHGAVSYPAARRALGRHIGKDHVILRKDLSHMFPLHVPEFAAQMLSRAIDGSQF